MSESGAPIDSFEVLLRRRMVSASDRALRPFEPSAIALKAAAGSVARPAAKSAGRTAWYVLLAAMLVLTALVFAAGSGAFRNLIVTPVGPSPSAAFLSCSDPLAPSQAAVPASPSVSASSAGADGLILFGVSVSVGDGWARTARCSTPSARMGAASDSCPSTACPMATRAGAPRATASSSTARPCRAAPPRSTRSPPMVARASRC